MPGMKCIAHYPVPILARYLIRYPTKSGSSRIPKIAFIYLFISINVKKP